jgi:hypothetical protein
MEKVDVVISVYGKPWQTLCTLKSLTIHSGKHIDKIFLIREKEQPYNESIEWIYKYFDNIIPYTPKKFLGHKNNKNFNIGDETDRFTVRHQYGFEKSDKKFIFITHNDVLYTENIIGNMLNNIANSVGIGQIGQCWNCPAFSDGLCSGEKFYEWNPTIGELHSFKLPHIRTTIDNIDYENVKPMPECRLNEWACLINREMSNSETYPNNDTPFFGIFGLDSGTPWFRSLYFKNYKFIDYRKDFIHGYWSEIQSGYQTQLNKQSYINAEKNAKKYFLKHYDNNNILHT